MRRDQESVAELPFTTLFGLMEIVQLGGRTTGGGTSTALAVTDAVQEFVPAELVTEIVYGVVALDGGVISIDPEVPRIVFPGLSAPVCTLRRDQESVADPPLVIFFGLITIEQLGGTSTALLETSAKYEK